MKGGLKCSIVCVSCQRVSCLNSTTYSEVEEIMDESEILAIDTDESDTEDPQDLI